jgi:hypothetical protein
LSAGAQRQGHFSGSAILSDFAAYWPDWYFSAENIGKKSGQFETGSGILGGCAAHAVFSFRGERHYSFDDRGGCSAGTGNRP